MSSIRHYDCLVVYPPEMSEQIRDLFSAAVEKAESDPYFPGDVRAPFKAQENWDKPPGEFEPFEEEIYQKAEQAGIGVLKVDNPQGPQPKFVVTERPLLGFPLDG